MNILYAIQGTGNGHLSRARAIVPELLRHGQVDILVSGTQVDVQLGMPVRYRFQGLGYIFGKSGGIDLLATYRKTKLRRFKKEINSLPVQQYDLVISDFEPVSAWACLQQGKPCIGLSHQSAVLQPGAPLPEHKNRMGVAFLNYYAPTTRSYGFHFKAYDRNTFTPVIRPGVRSLVPQQGQHYTVYLPAYDDDHLLEVLGHFPDTEWQVFSKHATSVIETDHITLQPIDDAEFMQSLGDSKGVLCGAGFETPAEALFLRKKLLVIPMKGQYEQHCNAAALKRLGVPVVKSLKLKHREKIGRWLQEDRTVSVDYPDQTAEIIDRLVADFGQEQVWQRPAGVGKKFRKSLFQQLVLGYINA